LFSIGRTLHQKGVKKYFLQKYRPVASDTTTTDYDCEAIVSDEATLNFLKSAFVEFDVRK